MERKDYLNPQELARLWNLHPRHVIDLVNEMRAVGKWSDSMIRPLRTTLVTPDAFEEFLKWRDMDRWEKRHEQEQ